MNTISNDSKVSSPHVRKLMIFFALVYVAEGMGQVGGLIHQPLNYFLKEVMHWDADMAAEYVAVLTFPWVIKPLYGLISDFLPLFGYRRKSYLLIMNALTVLAFVALYFFSSAETIIVALFVTATGMAASSTLAGAVLVENGKRTGLNAKFVGQQWLWFFITSIGVSLLAGWLCNVFQPAVAFHTAAVVTAIGPLAVVLTSWSFIPEQKAQMNVAQLKASAHGLLGAFKSRTLWTVAGFIAFWNFSPSFGTPLYYYMTNTLHFSQGTIGILNAVNAGGCAIGSLIFMYGLSGRVSLKVLLYLSVLFGVISTLAFLFMSNMTNAIVLNLATGVAGQIAILTTLTLAANACPDKAEGFSYAILMSVNNLAMQGSAIIGSYMYVHFFNNSMTPLIYVSAATTAMCAVLVPLLPISTIKKDKEEKV